MSIAYPKPASWRSDYNGSKTPHQRDVPHSHFSVQALVQFVHEKGQMKSGNGQHFHLSGPHARGQLHERHDGAGAAAELGHSHGHSHGDGEHGHTH
jgi:hypothetical protein